MYEPDPTTARARGASPHPLAPGVRIHRLDVRLTQIAGRRFTDSGCVGFWSARGNSPPAALGPAPHSFVAALRQRNVQVAVGECVVETDASAAPIVLDLVRQMELPLVLAFNAGRLMVLQLEQLHRMGRPPDAVDALRPLVDERYTLVPRM
jgi:hypothetical protein